MINSGAFLLGGGVYTLLDINGDVDYRVLGQC
jgi:hypothetical protein